MSASYVANIVPRSDMVGQDSASDPGHASNPLVYFATGVQSNVEKLPYLQRIVDKYPVECFDGMPAFTDETMWKPDVPLFMTGRFAALRVGPGAANLEGARLGAERIVWELQDVLGNENPGGSADEGASPEVAQGQSKYRFAAGIGSRYESLEVEQEMRSGLALSMDYVD